MSRVFSGIQPTGDVHLGNYLGAIKNWVAMQDTHDAVYCVVDLHALTVPHEPDALRAKTLRLVQILYAIGLDPERSLLFVQSHVRAHAECAWLMECTASLGELRRMTQFKDKAEQADFISAGLFTYPALQAADILLYDTEMVPVGEDQRQHIELTRDLAGRFNSRYGETFVIPEPTIPPTGARIMDLQRPESKMSKSADSPQGSIGLMDDPAVVLKKFKRAVTDSETEVRFDPEHKPGVSNLLSILAVATDGDPVELADQFEQYGALKSAAGEAVSELLAPIQARFRELEADPGATMALLRDAATRASEQADRVLDRAKENVGLLGPA